MRDENAYPKFMAVEKWCPFARIMGFDQEGPGNRGPGHHQIPEEAKCITDGCMAWQWEGDPKNGVGYCGLVRGAGR